MASKRNIDKWTFKDFNDWWRMELYRIYIGAFRWTGSVADTLPPWVIERMLYNNREIALVSNIDDKVIRPFFTPSSSWGVTDYDCIFTNLTYATPLHSGDAYIASSGYPSRGSDYTLAEPLYDSASRVPGKVVVSRYANLLAHGDLTIRSYLINCRATGIIAASNDTVGASINAWYDGLLDGKLMSVVDDVQLESLIGAQGLRSVSTSYPSSHSLLDLIAAQRDIIRAFYAERGIEVAADKKERLVVSEVSSNQNYLQYNINSPLAIREDFCRRCGECMGIDIKVEAVPLRLIREQQVAPTQREGSDDTETIQNDE